MLNIKKNFKKNICLVGLMGSGKSVIGRELSKYYKIDFFDSDTEIEKKTGKSINLIFMDSGEDYFRKIEEKICLKLLNKNDCIISLGGGSIKNSKIRDKIKNNSYSIYLNVDINILSKRLNNSTKRPLLKDTNKIDKLKELYFERKEFYNKADLILNNNFEKKKIIDIIKSKIKI
tara:strand:+ start:91 stop:615 length:525 start_codon:yes stop_codon:yes gene_type:complete